MCHVIDMPHHSQPACLPEQLGAVSGPSRVITKCLNLEETYACANSHSLHTTGRTEDTWHADEWLAQETREEYEGIDRPWHVNDQELHDSQNLHVLKMFHYDGNNSDNGHGVLPGQHLQLVQP